MNKSATRGRRLGSPDTKAQILAVAARRFRADGYQNVALRSIAAEVGVDAALISYFFGSKKGLFGAVFALAANPAELLAAQLPGDLNTLPQRALRALLTTWDDPESGSPLLTLLKSTGDDPAIAQIAREAIEREIIDKVAERLGGVRARRRAAGFTTVMSGIIFSRYLLALDPIATMPADELVRLMAPALHAVLLPPPPQRRLR
jgi:AcrR family transcriptional regulator